MVTQKKKTTGNGVFTYWHSRHPDDQRTTMWLLRFYGSVFFLGATLNSKDWPEDERLPTY